MGENELQLEPPAIVRVFSIIAGATAAAFLLWAVRSFDRLTWFGIFLMSAAIVLFFFTAIDAMQRRYVISKSAVRVRVLFRWKTHSLPEDVQFEANRSGQVVLTAPMAQRPILKIPREYNRKNQLIQALENLLRSDQQGRI